MMNGKKIQITKPTLKQLREAVSEIKAKQYFGKDTMNNSMTVNQLFEMWKAQKIGLKDNVFQNYIYSYEAFVKNYLGNKKIDTVITNSEKISKRILRKYETEEQKDLVIVDEENININNVKSPLVRIEDGTIRHDSMKLGLEILNILSK